MLVPVQVCVRVHYIEMHRDVMQDMQWCCMASRASV
jgi:hypothetical protein